MSLNELRRHGLNLLLKRIAAKQTESASRAAAIKELPDCSVYGCETLKFPLESGVASKLMWITVYTVCDTV